MMISKLTEFTEKMNRMANNGESFLFVIDYSLSSGIVIPTHECGSQGIFYVIDGFSNCKQSSITQDIQLKKFPVPYEEYLESYLFVQKEIHKGNSYLVNLTFSTPVTINLGLSDIFHQSSARYKLLFKDQFLVFSPECFIKTEGNKLSTFPMKGTLDASVKNARELLLENEKETAEHATIVDLLRNDLSRVASDVKVEKYKYIEEIRTSGKNLLQMSSVVSGNLPADYRKRLGTILVNLLPAGSISGAPKKATLEIIAGAEKHERGFYTGIFGIFDGINLNSGVMIRFIENQGGQLIYKSGGGITAMSDPLQEYQELIDKIYVPVD